MASITRCGTCVPPGPSKKTGCWFKCSLIEMVCPSAGNCERTQPRSSAAGGDAADEAKEEEKEADGSAIGMAAILMRTRRRVSPDRAASTSNLDQHPPALLVRQGVWAHFFL